MNRTELVNEIFNKHSFLCVGLDSDLTLLPEAVKGLANPQYEFNMRIIEATEPYAVSYKINTAFYESAGPKGWAALEKTFASLPKNTLSIADAKRGDIGNTAQHYAKAFFEVFQADAVTINPYMGHDSVKPFLEFNHKWSILLALTSNPGANDFEMQEMANGRKLYESVLEESGKWGTPNNTMYVAGATRIEQLASIRNLMPHHFLLVPGIGAQGGNLADVAKAALTADCGLLVNSSRSILFASSGPEYYKGAGEEAQKLQRKMESLLAQYC